MRRLLTSLALAALLTLNLSAQGGAKGKGSTPPAGKQSKEVPAADRCIAKTQDGDQCKRKAAAGSKYCWQHDPNRKSKSSKKA